MGCFCDTDLGKKNEKTKKGILSKQIKIQKLINTSALVFRHIFIGEND